MIVFWTKIIMCTEERMMGKPSSQGSGKDRSVGAGLLAEKAYLQLKPSCVKKPAVVKSSRVFEKCMFVATLFLLILLSHAVVSYQWALPWFYACATPVLVFFKTVCYWKNKWQFFMIDFCYAANTIMLIYMGLPGSENLFRVAFALANGPVLMAAAVYRNSLVLHDYDKVTSVYIHLQPAIITFCVHWWPSEISGFWHKPFVSTSPEFDLIWLYAVPFACFFLHSCIYCLVVNVIVRPKDPYLTSYKYLAEKYEKLNFIKGPIGQAVAYYGFNWLFCLVSLLFGLLAYWSFVGHCLILTAVFTIVVYNGASYYVYMFSKLATRTDS